MKNHNKLIIGSILSLAMLFTVASCNGNQEPSNSHSDDPTTVVPPTVPEPSEDPTTSEQTSENIGSKYPCITVAEAIKLATEAGSEGTAEEKYVFATIKTVKNPEFGEMVIEDETGEIYVFGINGYKDMEYQPVKGDLVVIKGTLQSYKGNPEFAKSDIVEFKHVVPQFDDGKYKEYTIAKAREQEPGALVKISGVVSRFTYNNPEKVLKSGFFLIDDTGSILIHDIDACSQVLTGNRITLYGERSNYISSREVEFAEKWGYTGSIQVTNVKIIENDNQMNETNISWVEETTIKKILRTPINPNITNTIYKVKAYINKVPGPDPEKSYTNYYFNDLDRKTSTYAYSTCDGKDFSWLDPFDGKLCDVYITPTNVKSQYGGTFYRFIPISVNEATVGLETKDFPEYILDYHVLDQFMPEYNANPDLELITSVSDATLGIENATIEYTSSNPDAFEIVRENDKTKLIAKNDGTSEISITVKCGNYTKITKINLTYKFFDVSQAKTVKEAIDAEDGETVTVRGVVMASAVNRDAFYIADETGVMAILTDAETLKSINIGHLVTFEGTKKHFKEPETTAAGQETLVDSKLVLNEYGKHDYSTASFDSTQTIDTLRKMDAAEDHTAQVYVVKAKIEVVETPFYTSMKICSTTSNETLNVYCSSASQYKWLNQFKNEPEVTLELALCNWNDKNYYACCVLSAQAGEAKVMNTYNFSK